MHYVTQTTDVFCGDSGFTDLPERWASVASRWITHSDDAEVIARSAQVLRALKVPVTQQLIGEILDRLTQFAGSADADGASERLSRHFLASGFSPQANASRSSCSPAWTSSPSRSTTAR